MSRTPNEGPTTAIPPVDHDLVSILLPFVELLRMYHRHEVVGLENIPEKGGGLIVVNHSLATYDIVLLWAAIYEQTGRLTRGLVDRLFYKVPGVGPFITGLGVAEGSPLNAARLLKSGELVCVAPGGMREALRPSSHRYKIDWGSRKGFARLAAEQGVPIILAACPRADELYDVFPSPLTRWAYERLKIPLFFARGVGPTPIPRPIKLTHYLSKPMAIRAAGDEGFNDADIERFRNRLVRKMKQLMARGLVG